MNRIAATRALRWHARALLASCVLSCACNADEPMRKDPNAPVTLWRIPDDGIAPPFSQPDFRFDAGFPQFGFDAAIPWDGDEDDAGRPVYPSAERAVLDPDQVYLFGTLQHGTCGHEAIAPVTAPNRALAGFSCDADTRQAMVRPTDGRLLYWETSFTSNGDPLYAFYCDGCSYARAGDPYPHDPTSNDRRITIVRCAEATSRLNGFVVAANGKTLHRCSNDTWYTGGGTAIAALTGETLRAMGQGNTALVENAVIDLGTGARKPFTELDGYAVRATRTRDDGYWIAAYAVDHDDIESPMELWHIAFDGSAKRLGAYPDPPAHQRLSIGEVDKLDGTGRLVQLAGDDRNSNDTIIRRSIEGVSEVIYDEADNPVIQIHISSLVTGP